MADPHDFVKIFFDLETDDPESNIAGEALWAIPLGGDVYRLANIPMFAWNVSYGNDVRASHAKDGRLVVVHTVAHGGRLTCRLVMVSDDRFEALLAEVRDAIVGFRIGFEASEAYRIVALNIAPDERFTLIKHPLQRGVEAGKWKIEESNVTSKWQSA